MLYLQNPIKFENDLKNSDDLTFLLPKKTIIRKEIKNLLERVLNNEHGEKILCPSDTASCSNNSDKDQE